MKLSSSNKINGFTQHLTIYQAGSWLMVSTEVLCFFSLYVPVLDIGCVVIYSLAYIFFAISLTIFAYLCTNCDPTDPIVALERAARMERKFFNSKSFNQVCTICKTHVLDNSKHCGKCDRCVDRFDHHCKWLNNCIGGRNYSLFCGCIASLEGLALIQTAAGCFIIGSILNKDEVYDAAKELFFVDGNGVAYVTVILVTSFLAFVILVFNGHLIIFHVWLYNKGMTTYDYIVFKRQRKQKVVRPQLPQSSDVHDETIDNTFSRMAIISGAPPKHLELVFNYKERPVSRVQSLSDSFQKQEMKHHSSVESEESKLGEEVNYGNSV
mmetsp:Transcript_19135/g.34862  ORF Transcript_19135/g.34862 Transcript_19135/m.34862 type:complete len:324 (-) Transcript_19135:638-1609(-)